MLTNSALKAAIPTLRTRWMKGIVYRASNAAYLIDPLAKKRKIGRNRFNVEGGARMLYTAGDIFTPLHELQAYGWPPQAISIVPVNYQLKSVLDLRDSHVQALLQTTTSEIEFNFRSVVGRATPTEELGEAIAASGMIDGIIFNSCAWPPDSPPQWNLAIVECALGALGSRIEAEDPLLKVNHHLP